MFTFAIASLVIASILVIIYTITVIFDIWVNEESSILPGIVGFVMCAMWFLTALFLLLRC